MGLSKSDIEEIKKIAQDFINDGAIKRKEEHIQSSYTLEVLKLLGWSRSSWIINEPQEVQTGKKPDLLLLGSGGGSIFVIESKEPSKSLDDRYKTVTFVDQLCNYCNAEGIYWGILTNFVEWRIYNSYTKQLYYNKKFKLILDEKTNPRVNPNDDELLELFNSIELHGLRAKKGRVDENPIYYKEAREIREEFFSQLKIWRKDLRNYLYTKYHSKYPTTELDNQTQKILDRLIFIQFCYQKNIVSQDYLGAVLYSEKKSYYNELQKKFGELNEKFNSELFATDLCDDPSFDIGDEVSEEIIRGINAIDFSNKNINAHIIGEVYEDYLGELLKDTKTQVKVDESRESKKRKTQGIFYTPQEIVDFIIQNTLVPKLNQCKSVRDIEKIRVIDPACGSGSFLIKAYDYFYNAYKSLEEKKKHTSSLFFEYEVRKKILTQNIFGVDLDERAVEIAKLNLFLKALDGLNISDLPQQRILPNLSLNIQCGNSLIFGNDPENISFKSEEQLDLFDHSFIGKTYLQKLVDLKNQFFEENNLQIREKLLDKIRVAVTSIEREYNEPLEQYFPNLDSIKPFNYHIKYCEVFDKGGFDCVIGNPPWSAKISNTLNNFISERYALDAKNLNIFAPFLILSMKLIKEDGMIGLLIPKVFIKNSSYQPIRENIIDNYSLVNLIDFGKFPKVASDCVSPIISREKKRKTELIIYQKDNIQKSSVNQKIFSKNPIYAFSFSITEDKVKTLGAIEKNTVKLSPAIAKIKRGIELGQKSMVTRCHNCRTWNEAGEKYYNEKNKKKCKSCGHKLTYDKVTCISSKTKSQKYSKHCLSGKQIDYYQIKDGYFILSELNGFDYKDDISKGDRIFIKEIATHPIGVFLNSRKNYFAFNTIVAIYNCKYDARFILGILNSRLMRFYWETTYNLGVKLTMHMRIEYLRELPIKEPNLKQKGEKEIYDSIIKDVDELQELASNAERNKIKIEAIQSDIDKKVEKLYEVEISE
ncbi:MAG: N-6 DNA methylase [Bacteroidetes bacterium]|nr:N-6 DNA methylase [Bacteroidota bacterium]